MTAWITSVGLLSPLGVGREAFVAGWRSGAAVPVGGLGPSVGALNLRTWFPEQRNALRRMDRLSKLIAAAAGLCREDAGLGPAAELGLAVGTDLGTLEGTWAFLSRLRDKGPALANPAEFPNLVPNAGAGYLGIFLGMQGLSHTFCQHACCGDDAVAWARDAIVSGRLRGVVAGGAEELGLVRLAATEAASCPEANPGEGGAFVLIESPERATERGAVPLAAVEGSWGARGRARSPLVFEPDRAAVERLLRHALDRAGLTAADVGGALLSHPGHAALESAVDDVFGAGLPRSDHGPRLGSHPADGAFRVALAALLVADPTLPIHADAGPLRARRLLVLSAGRGGALRATFIGAP